MNGVVYEQYKSRHYTDILGGIAEALSAAGAITGSRLLQATELISASVYACVVLHPAPNASRGTMSKAKLNPKDAAMGVYNATQFTAL